MSTIPENTSTPASGGLLQWLETRINLTELFALLTSLGLFYVEVDAKKPFRAAIREALSKPMSSYVKWPRVLGPLAVLFFVFQLVTGSLLAFYYRPSLLEAHESLRVILRDVNFGWLFHQVHRWGGQLLIIILLARVVRFFFECVYKKPRELLWITSALLFLVATHADFTGRLLSWNQVSYWTTVRGLELLFMLPIIGPLFAFLVGGTEITGFTLSRFYFLHIAVLPVSILLLFYFSFATVRRVGLTVAPEEVEVGGRKQYLGYLFNILILIVVILGILVSLAVLLPVPFRPEADPFSTPASIGPPWYLSAAHVLVEAFPPGVPELVPGALLLVLLVGFVFWPFLDRSHAIQWRSRVPALLFGTTVLVAWLILTAYGSFSGGFSAP